MEQLVQRSLAYCTMSSVTNLWVLGSKVQGSKVQGSKVADTLKDRRIGSSEKLSALLQINPER